MIWIFLFLVRTSVRKNSFVYPYDLTIEKDCFKLEETSRYKFKSQILLFDYPVPYSFFDAVKIRSDIKNSKLTAKLYSSLMGKIR